MLGMIQSLAKRKTEKRHNKLASSGRRPSGTSGAGEGKEGGMVDPLFVQPVIVPKAQLTHSRFHLLSYKVRFEGGYVVIVELIQLKDAIEYLGRILHCPFFTIS